MEKQKENLFLQKFSILNSQEHSEEIQWSSSSSSEYDETSINDRSSNQVHRIRVLKRKRKKKSPKNISHLSITILDTSREAKKNICVEYQNQKSPILGSKTNNSLSPILKLSRSFNKDNTGSSPILMTKRVNARSPILVSKTASPKLAMKERKKLFSIGKLNEKGINNENQNAILNREELTETFIKKEIESITNVELEEINQIESLNKNSSNAKLELVKQVKSFFNSNFSSENTSQTSQNSISEVSTPKSISKTSEEIEIFTCKTQITNTDYKKADSKQELLLSENSSENSSYDFNKSTKKIHHKKNGYAYRLNKLVKKQNASVSLWQHERFLAANSNFIIPKEEFTVFRIQKFNIKYGCHLVECVNANDDLFLILLNSCYVLESIACESVLKLYKPFKILAYNRYCKLIINVIKFECSSIKY